MAPPACCFKNFPKNFQGPRLSQQPVIADFIEVELLCLAPKGQGAQCGEDVGPGAKIGEQRGTAAGVGPGTQDGEASFPVRRARG